MTDPIKAEVSAGRYLADRFQWAAPGDQQEDAWLVRFCDRDCGDAIFTGPDAEAEAWAYWERYAPSFNIYVFRLAALSDTPTPSTPVQGAGEAGDVFGVFPNIDAETDEPSLRNMVLSYYRAHFPIGEAFNLTDRYFAALSTPPAPASGADEARAREVLANLYRAQGWDRPPAFMSHDSAIAAMLAFAARPAGEVERLREAECFYAAVKNYSYPDGREVRARIHATGWDVYDPDRWPCDAADAETLRAIVQVVADADSEDCVGSLDIDLPKNGYPRQWLRDAARAALTEGTPS